MVKAVEAGDAFPKFNLVDDSGNKVTEKDVSSGYAVLYFYPADDTPGCTKQACSIRDRWDELTKRNITLFGVSADDADSHNAFKDKYNLPFALLIDDGHKLAKKVGGYGEKNLYGKLVVGVKRTTFILKDGVIAKVIKRPDTSDQVGQILKEIDKLEV